MVSVQRVFLLGLMAILLNACDGADTRAFDVSVSGIALYQDKTYDARGFTGEFPLKAIRFADVQLVDGNVAVAITKTDANGYYQLQGSGVRLKVRVLAQSSAGVDSLVSVANLSGDVYAVSKTLAIEGESVMDFTVPVNQDVSGAFNILDILSNGKQFIASYDSALTAPLRAYWQPGNSDQGTYYCSPRVSRSSCPQGAGIYLLGGSGAGGDTDQYDDDVIYHEFGHFVEDQLGIQDSPGGTHYLSDNDADIRLSWSEGWGGFMPGAVKAWLAGTQPELLSSSSGLPSSYFVDTYGQYAMISMDFGDPNSYYCWGSKACYSYSSSEVAVANVLNGLNANYGFDMVWDSVSQYLPYGTRLPASLETFWDGLMLQQQPASDELNQLQSIFARSSIFYSSDNYEYDDSYAAAKPYSDCSACNTQQRYLYNAANSADRDYVYVDLVAGKHYLIETYNLGNAADTYMRILNADGSQAYSQGGAIMANDNASGVIYCMGGGSSCGVQNTDSLLSSKLTFTPTQSATFVVEVSTSINRPPSAGRYGSYSLRVTEI